MTLDRYDPIIGKIASSAKAMTAAEMSAIAARAQLGLSAAFVTRRTAHGIKVARQIHSGICHINASTVSDEPQMPFGATKASAYGRFGGKAGIDSFTELMWITFETELGHQPIRYGS